MDLIYKIDFFILDAIQKYMRCSFLDWLMVFFTRLGDIGIIWVVLALFCLATDKYRKLGAAITFALVIALLLGNELLKDIFMRQRPFQVKDFSIIIAPPPGYSFPSGHTMSSFAAAAAIGLTHKRFKKWAYILAALIGFSRIYLYVHFPTDVLIGVLLGILFGWLGAAIIYRKVKFKR